MFRIPQPEHDHLNSGRRRSRARRGIALIDVIIGGVMLAVGLAVVISMATRSMAMQTNGEKRMVAAWLADEKLSMIAVEGPDVYPDLYDLNGWFDEPFEQFQYDLQIEEQGVREPYRVTATIRWPSGADMDSITIETLIARRLGEPFQPREPLEMIDRDGRWYEIKYGESLNAPSGGQAAPSGEQDEQGESNSQPSLR